MFLFFNLGGGDFCISAEACISDSTHKCDPVFGGFRGASCRSDIVYPRFPLAVPEYCGERHTAPRFISSASKSSAACKLVPYNTRKEEKTLTGALNVVNRYILAQESNCNEKRYGYDKVVKEFPVLTRLIKQAADKSNAQKSMNDNACWLNEGVHTGPCTSLECPNQIITESDQFPQSQKLNPEDTMYLGALLALLCSLITFMDFVTAFLPETYPLRMACDIKAIIHKLICTCGGIITPKKIKKDELDPAFDDQYGEDEKEERRLAREAIVQKALESKDRKARAKKKMRTKILMVNKFYTDKQKNSDTSERKNNIKRAESKKAEEYAENSCGQKIKLYIYSKIMATTTDDMRENFDNLLAYIMVNVPFNLLLASCSSTSWELMKEPAGSREDNAGLFVISSDIAVDIVDMPVVFFLTVLYFLVMVGPWLANVKAKTDQQRRTSYTIMLDTYYWKAGMDAKEASDEFIKKDKVEHEKLMEQLEHHSEIEENGLYPWVLSGFTFWGNTIPFYFAGIICQPCKCINICRKGSKSGISVSQWAINGSAKSEPKSSENFAALKQWEKYAIMVGDDFDNADKYKEHFSDDSALFGKKFSGEKELVDTSAADKIQKEPPESGRYNKQFWEPSGRSKKLAETTNGVGGLGSYGANIYKPLDVAYINRVMANYSWPYFAKTYATAVTFLCFFAWLGISIWLFLQQLAQVNLEFVSDVFNSSSIINVCCIIHNILTFFFIKHFFILNHLFTIFHQIYTLRCHTWCRNWVK